MIPEMETINLADIRAKHSNDMLIVTPAHVILIVLLGSGKYVLTIIFNSNGNRTVLTVTTVS